MWDEDDSRQAAERRQSVAAEGRRLPSDTLIHSRLLAVDRQAGALYQSATYYTYRASAYIHESTQSRY